MVGIALATVARPAMALVKRVVRIAGSVWDTEVICGDVTSVQDRDQDQATEDSRLRERAKGGPACVCGVRLAGDYNGKQQKQRRAKVNVGAGSTRGLTKRRMQRASARTRPGGAERKEGEANPCSKELDELLAPAARAAAASRLVCWRNNRLAHRRR
jgi:hypothetical protein